MRNLVKKVLAGSATAFVAIVMIAGPASASSDHDHNRHSHDHDRQSAEVTTQTKQASDSDAKPDTAQTDVKTTPVLPKVNDEAKPQPAPAEKVDAPAPTNPVTVKPATTPPAPSPPSTDEDHDTHDVNIQFTVSQCQEVTLDQTLDFSTVPTDSSMSKNPQWYLDGNLLENVKDFSGSVSIMPGSHTLELQFSNRDEDDRKAVNVEVPNCPIHHPSPPPEEIPPTVPTPPAATPAPPVQNVVAARVECVSGVHTLHAQVVSGDSNVAFSPENNTQLPDGKPVMVTATWHDAEGVTAVQRITTSPAACTTTNAPLAFTGAETWVLALAGILLVVFIGGPIVFFSSHKRRWNQAA